MTPSTVNENSAGSVGAVAAPNYRNGSWSPGRGPAQSVRKMAWRRMRLVFQAARIRFGNLLELPPLRLVRHFISGRQN